MTKNNPLFTITLWLAYGMSIFAAVKFSPLFILPIWIFGFWATWRMMEDA